MNECMKGFRTGIVVIIRGYSGGEATMSFTPSGKAVTKFRLGVGSGEKIPTVWMTCQVWELPDAEEVQKIIDRKGLAVVLVGRMMSREFRGKTYINVNVDALAVENGGELRKVNLRENNVLNEALKDSELE